MARLTGSNGNDRISGTGGDDRIDGLAGHDVLSGEGGQDDLFGGAGNDRLLGGPGVDVLWGGSGDDLFVAGSGADLVAGGAGFDMLDLGRRAKPSEAMEGLISEGQEVIEGVDDPEVRDAGLIVSAQKVEHYEIAGYGSLVAMAKQLGYTEAGSLLSQTLEEEKAADSKLNKIALSNVNKKAA